MDDWKRIISDDPQYEGRLMLEIWHEDKLICIIRHKKTDIILTWFEKDLDIPFDWFYKIMYEAKERII